MLTGLLSTVIELFNSLPSPVQKVTAAMAGVGGPAAVLAGILPVISGGIATTAGVISGALTPAVGALTSVMMANPLLAGAAAFGGMVFLLHKLGYLDDLINVVKLTFNRLAKVVKGSLSWAFKHWKKILLTLVGPGGWIIMLLDKLGILKPMLENIKRIVDAMIAPFRRLGRAISKIPKFGGSPTGSIGMGGSIAGGGSIDQNIEFQNTGTINVRADDPNEFRRKWATSGYRRR